MNLISPAAPRTFPRDTRLSPADVRRALAEGEFRPHFQPLVALDTGKIDGFELLARWHHLTLGLVPPDRFIPAAEQDHWIDQLTTHILLDAFATAINLPPHLRISINISPIQLRDFTLPNLLEELSARTGFPLNRLVIELTESGLIDNLDTALKITTRLKELGCGLALDDFGTGYSSLRHLQALPFDLLKIDRSFIAAMTHRPDSHKIVAAVVNLGHSLGLHVVAEGIETLEQADIMIALGCDLGQGWLFGRPKPAGELNDVLASETEFTETRNLPIEREAVSAATRIRTRTL